MGFGILLLLLVPAVIMAAVAASGLGPIASLRRTVARLGDVRDEADRVRRNVDRAQRNLALLREGRHFGGR